MRSQNKTYHQMVAQNFLRNISLDGSHDDTALRIFKDGGLHFTLRHRDLSLNAPSSRVSEDGSSIGVGGTTLVGGGRIRSISGGSIDDGGDIVPVVIPSFKSEMQQQRRIQQRFSLQKSLDAEPPSSPFLKKGASTTADTTNQKSVRRRKLDSFRSRLGSAGHESDSTGRPHHRLSHRHFESTGESLLEKLKSPFSSQHHRRHHHHHHHETPKSTSAHHHHPSITIDHGGRSVKWGTLPAVSSMESLTTRASILSTKGGELVVVDGDFSDPRAIGARICLCRKQLPLMICSVLPHKRTGALLRRLEPSSDAKSVSSTDEIGLKPFVMRDEEISYSPLLVPSHSNHSIMNFSGSSETLSYMATTSGQSSISSAFGVGDISQSNVPPLSSNLLTVEGGGHKHDLSIESDVPGNRGSLVFDFRQLDDPEFGAGKHKTILTFTSYMTSLIDYVNRDEMKREVNEKFRKKFPEIRLTYSKYQSLRRDMKSVASSIQLDLLTLAQAYCYFDTVVLKALISKTNRKLVACACLLLAAKMTDVKGADLKSLTHKLEETFRLNRKEFVQYELPVVVALEFGLHVPMNDLSAQYQKLLWSS